VIVVDPAGLSISSASIFAMATSLSPSSILIRRTPWALRPVSRISLTRVRMRMPFSEMSINSSVSQTAVMPTTLPLRSVVLMLITPLPPRLIRR